MAELLGCFPFMCQAANETWKRVITQLRAYFTAANLSNINVMAFVREQHTQKLMAAILPWSLIDYHAMSNLHIESITSHTAAFKLNTSPADIARPMAIAIYIYIYIYKQNTNSLFEANAVGNSLAVWSSSQCTSRPSNILWLIFSINFLIQSASGFAGCCGMTKIVQRPHQFRWWQAWLNMGGQSERDIWHPLSAWCKPSVTSGFPSRRGKDVVLWCFHYYLHNLVTEQAF